MGEVKVNYKEVPSVQELAKKKLVTIPSRYVRDSQDRSLIASNDHNKKVPVIDMQPLMNSNDHHSMNLELNKLHFAAQEWGFFQIFSNGIYRSIEHRSVVSSEKERISVVTFHSPRLDGILGPSSSLVTADKPPIFKNIGVTEYFRGYFNRELVGKSYVDTMKITSQDDLKN